jgi:hypothetical protein
MAAIVLIRPGKKFLNLLENWNIFYYRPKADTLHVDIYVARITKE